MQSFHLVVRLCMLDDSQTLAKQRASWFEDILVDENYYHSQLETSVILIDLGNFKYLLLRLHEKNGCDIYLAFNAHSYFVKAGIPSPPPKRHWFRVADTNLESPDDFVPQGVAGIGKTYNVAPYSSILLEAK